MKTIVWLRDIRSKDRVAVGGKAAILGELKAAGCNVPDGFVVTIDGLRQGLSDLLRAECLLAFDALGASRVAVRSSAVGEDSKRQSWAGEFETYTNVTRDALIDKIEKVVASAGSARALSYKKQNQTEVLDVSVAVLVQMMVPAEVAGVLFSVNPVTNDATRMLIEASHGLGESVVSGLVIPDHIVVDKNSGDIITYDAENKQLLDQTMAQELVTVGKKIEVLLGAPVDVEWAFANGSLYVLQARPITT